MLVLAFKGDAQEQTVNSAVVQTSNVTNTEEGSIGVPEDLSVAVFRTKSNVIEEVDFEDYIVGVVSSEMPADFSLEALKAQALTARTFIIRHMLNPLDTNIPEGAIVLDTVIHQVYQNEDELRKKWGKDYERRHSKILEAVQSTRGQVITYEGEPITATFFSTSNGYTENSEDYWPNEIPYLRSVESPWDTQSPRYVAEKVISTQQFTNALGVQLPNDGTVGEITARTDSGRVATVNISGKSFTGREIREALDLDSSDFRWKRNGDNVVIETRGWGHGVGMSQYGANGLAKEGKSYQEIIQHYYQGVQISSVEPFMTALAD